VTKFVFGWGTWCLYCCVPCQIDVYYLLRFYRAFIKLEAFPDLCLVGTLAVYTTCMHLVLCQINVCHFEVPLSQALLSPDLCLVETLGVYTTCKCCVLHQIDVCHFKCLYHKPF
jgi:hypothetical protein